eukprot:SAG31_NODE_1948_length_6834_cov_16.124276_8_plen_403_part_00
MKRILKRTSTPVDANDDSSSESDDDDMTSITSMGALYPLAQPTTMPELLHQVAADVKAKAKAKQAQARAKRKSREAASRAATEAAAQAELEAAKERKRDAEMASINKTVSELLQQHKRARHTVIQTIPGPQRDMSSATDLDRVFQRTAGPTRQPRTGATAVPQRSRAAAAPTTAATARSAAAAAAAAAANAAAAAADAAAAAEEEREQQQSDEREQQQSEEPEQQQSDEREQQPSVDVEEYDVDSVVDKRIDSDGRVWYRVHWTGSDSEVDTWEPADCLLNAFDAVADYETQQAPPNEIEPDKYAVIAKIACASNATRHRYVREALGLDANDTITIAQSKDTGYAKALLRGRTVMLTRSSALAELCRTAGIPYPNSELTNPVALVKRILKYLYSFKTAHQGQ